MVFQHRLRVCIRAHLPLFCIHWLQPLWRRSNGALGFLLGQLGQYFVTHLLLPRWIMPGFWLLSIVLLVFQFLLPLELPGRGVFYKVVRTKTHFRGFYMLEWRVISLRANFRVDVVIEVEWPRLIFIFLWPLLLQHLLHSSIVSNEWSSSRFVGDACNCCKLLNDLFALGRIVCHCRFRRTTVHCILQLAHHRPQLLLAHLIKSFHIL